MVRAWYIDDSSNKLGVPLQREPLQFLSLEELYKKTGIEYYKIEKEHVLQEIKKIRGYIYEDEAEITKDTLCKYEGEHMHSDDESRLVLEGSGYFDARDATTEQWVRIEIGAGDMLIIPAGIYHRFTLNTEKPMRQRRFFSEEPVWRAYSKPEADLMPARRIYLKRAKAGFTAEAVAC